MNRYVSLIPEDLIDEGAKEQIRNALKLEFLKKLVIMPDVHTGYSLPIGGVALLDDVVSPDYVGYDIGCGMCCGVYDVPASEILKTDFQKDKIFKDIYLKIPTGMKSARDKRDYETFKSGVGDRNLNKAVNEKIPVQLGTLGSGNHFIELGAAKDGRFAVTIHSGSRNMGHSIAGYYMKRAREKSELPDGFFALKSDLGQAYLRDMQFALEYALANRLHMFRIVENILGLEPHNSIINETHNHALIESNGVLHRKGATPAQEGQLGVIPGNMRDGVYITTGLGNSEYLCSASHGAGRVLGRNQAKKVLRLDYFKQQMKGVKAKIDNSTLEEAPDAYKNIHEVIKLQDGIVVKVLDHITPIINIKG